MRRELAFTAYNRVNYLEQTVASWNEVRRLDTWNAHFYIEPSSVQTYVTDAANELDTAVIAHFNSEHKGVLGNPWNAFNDRFNDGADFVVLAEDDVVVSSDILEYFEWASEEYKDDQSILAINAWTESGGEENEVFRIHYFSPLIWGIWRDRWETHLRDTWDFDYSTSNADGSQAGWDGNIWRIMQAKKLDCIQPRQSRSDHIGIHGGTHMTPDLYHTSRGVDFARSRGRQLYVEA
jgi:hypothetical protein